MKLDEYNAVEIEAKWQKRWREDEVFHTDLNSSKEIFYNLWMFPYPSGEGLHSGHAYASTGSDIYGRYMRMRGKEVFQPIGYDSFGIHSENFAIKIGEQPQSMLARTTKNYERQLRSLGHGYDWSRIVTTSDIDYYRWTQWIFVQMYKAGLAYRKSANVNWCPSCMTVLADEQVIEGRCERCGTEVEKKELMQWFFRITKYADKLLSNLDKIDWPEKIKSSQRNWIGKSEGMVLKFDDVEVFTTRPDTVHGATFLAVAGEKSRNGEYEKAGEFTGKYVINPATKKEIPVWKVNYVDESYGTGAIMGVPAHDARDREFATKYGIDIVKMKPEMKWWKKAEEERWGKKETHYHLRDWLISRQRYWGPPIPMIYCEACAKRGECWFAKNKGECPADWSSPGWYPVPEEQLPVKLPELVDYKPRGTGRGPLADHPEFYKVKCAECGADAERETDVSDTFLDSAWYFLRFPSVGTATAGKLPFDPEITKKWLPVSLYFGGAEHAVLHLMYARFVTMVLYDLKLVEFEEPFPRFFAHGLMIKDGAKMSKSRGNVVNPDQYIEKFGADAFRLYLMFIGPMDGSPDFRDTGMEGMVRWVNKLRRLKVVDGTGEKVGSELNRLVAKVTGDVEQYHYNTAIAAMMAFVNVVKEAGGGLAGEQMKVLVRLLAPFAPHLAEEMWYRLGNEESVHKQSWPTYNPKLIEDYKAVVVVQVNGKVRERLDVNKDTGQKEVEQMAMRSDRVKKYIEGRKYRVIYVPGRVLNIVLNDS